MSKAATKIKDPTLPVEAAPEGHLPAPRAHTRVNAIVPASWSEIASIAGAICRAGMAPKSYLDKDGNPVPDKVAIAIMHGMEVGMTPMASLQSLAVINGMPSLYGDGMLAVVRASGLLEDFFEDIEWDDKGPVLATCKVKRKGEATWGLMTCARADAQKAGWWDKAGPWKATPHRMMQMRARGWALRDKFADVLRGLKSAEEMQDMVDITPTGPQGPTLAEPSLADPPEAEQQGQPATAVDRKAEATDVEDLTENNRSNSTAADEVDEDIDDPDLWPERPQIGVKLEFQRFAKTKEFGEFAGTFLDRTNAEGARQFLEFYDGTFIAMDKGKPATQEMSKGLKDRAVAIRDAREPGEEG